MVMQKWFKYGRGTKLAEDEVSVTKGAFVYMLPETRMKYLPLEYVIAFFDLDNCLVGLQTSDDRYDGFKINVTTEGKRQHCHRIVLKQMNKTLRMAAGRYHTVWDKDQKLLVFKYARISEEKENMGKKGSIVQREGLAK